MYYYGGADFGSLLYYLGIAMALVSIALSFKVRSTYNRISQYETARRISGAEAAQRLLRANGIYDVTVQPISGTLSDNYNPSNKTLNLSQAVYSGRDIAAVAVAAHECGHAIQHAENYRPILLRSRLVPVANLGSQAGMLLFFVGLIFGSGSSTFLMDLGIFLFSFAVLFHVVTLGVEFDASRRALRALGNLSLLTEDEQPKASKMLRTAAYTYVAAMASAMIQLLRLVAIRNRRRN